MRTIRVFISSPSDVAPERAAAQRVIDRLRRQYHGRAAIDGFLWEDRGYEATSAFHRQIPLAGDFDAVVFILWSTLGSPITVDSRSYPSGTVFEYENALRASAQRRLPMLVYRKSAPVQLDVHADEAQLLAVKRRYDQVREFFDSNFAGFDGGLRGHNKFETTADFEERLEDDLRRVVDELAAIGAANGRHPPGPGADSPYKGLRLFDEGDQHFFFGRRHAVYQVMRALQRQEAAGRPFVVVFGRSGVGKSSFVRAGLAPYIMNSRTADGVSRWKRCLFEPSDSTVDLVGGLAAALCADDALPELAAAAGGPEGFAAMLRTTPAAAVAMIKASLAAQKGPEGPVRTALLLLVDPLEEMFTRRARGESAPDAETARQEQAQFARVLSLLCRDARVWIVATLRSDFYEQASAITELRELKQGDGQHHLAPLTATELSHAVLRPAEIAGIEFEESPERGSLADALINAALTHTEPLPLLSYALDQLYERSNAGATGRMTFRAFDELGGLEGALAKRADDARNAASRRVGEGMADAWNRVFTLLIDVDRDGRRVRQYARADQFSDPGAAILREELDRARLLITDKDDQGRPVVSIAHESMLREWPSLREWIDNRAELLRLRSMLANEARAWDSSGRNPDLLVLQGSRLGQAEEFLAKGDDLSVEPLVREYVGANLARRDADARAARRRRTIRVVIVAALVLAAGGAATYEVVRRERLREREAARLETERQREAARIATELKLAADLEKPMEKLRGAGHYGAAAGIYAESLAILRRASTLSPEQLASRLDTLANLYWQAADYRQNEAVLNESLEVRTKAGLGDSLGAHKTRGYLGNLEKAKSHYVRCEYLLQQSVSRLQSVTDPEGLLVLAGQYDQLGDIQRNLDRFEASESSSRQAIAIARDVASRADGKLADDAAQRLAVFESEFAVLLGQRNQFDEAIRLLEDARAELRSRPADHAAVLYKLVRVLVNADRLDQAQALADDSCGALSAIDPGHTRVAKAFEARAMVRLRRGQFPHAESDLRRALDIRRAKLQGPNPDIFEAMKLLAQALDGQGRSDEAAQERARANELEASFHDIQRADAAALGVPYP